MMPLNVKGASVIGREMMLSFFLEQKVRGPRIRFTIPNISRVIKAYYRLETIYGIRADVAICQMILETGWLQFNGSVPEHYNNFAGLGATTGDRPEGEVFETIEEGVEAHMQHLYAYVADLDLPEGVELVDKRFKYVKRGTVYSVDDLAMRWAMTENYGSRIRGIYYDAVKFTIRELVQEL